MFKPKLLDNGNILIPVRAEGENGVIGDSFKEVEPGSKEYQEWLSFLDDEAKEILNN